MRIVNTEHSHEAAEKAVAMARAGEVQSLMKGSLHTDELMGAVVHAATGLRTARRISHVFVLDVPAYPRMLLITDAAINVEPDARDKADIAQNAIDLAHVLGIDEPRVAILAAVETVNPDMQSTVDAAILCKMADRGQITGGLLDGPLAFDNAVSEEAARTKKIESKVAGRANILLAPDLEAGNMMAKQLQYLAGADSAGIVLGARVPIVLTSRVRFGALAPGLHGRDGAAGGLSAAEAGVAGLDFTTETHHGPRPHPHRPSTALAGAQQRRTRGLAAHVPVPEPGADEVLVRIEATPINPSDLGLLFGAADMSTMQVSGTAGAAGAHGAHSRASS